MRSAVGRATIALVLLISACSRGLSADCQDATTLATETRTDMLSQVDEFQQAQARADTAWPPGQYPPDQIEELRVRAAEARRVADSLRMDTLRTVERYTILVEQNAECFTVDQRVEAEQLRRRIAQQ